MSERRVKREQKTPQTIAQGHARLCSRQFSIREVRNLFLLSEKNCLMHSITSFAEQID